MKMVTLKAQPSPIEVDLQRTAVIVVDMQNTYWEKGGGFDLMGLDISGSSVIYEPINRVNDAARAIGCKVIWITTMHERDFTTRGGPDFPWRHKESAFSLLDKDPNCADALPFRGSWGAKIVKELKQAEGDITVEKTKYSGFFQTKLDIILKSLHVKYLIFTGGCTNICLGDTLKEAYRLGYFCLLVSDASKACGPPFSQDAEIANISYCYGWITTVDDVIKAMK